MVHVRLPWLTSYPQEELLHPVGRAQEWQMLSPMHSPSRRKLSLLKCPWCNLSNPGISHTLLGRFAMHDLRLHSGNISTYIKLGPGHGCQVIKWAVVRQANRERERTGPWFKHTKSGGWESSAEGSTEGIHSARASHTVRKKETSFRVVEWTLGTSDEPKQFTRTLRSMINT